MGELEHAQEALEASAAVARSQHARIQLGRTLSILARVARRHGVGPSQPARRRN
jgi:hypothetical protein